VTYDGSGSRFMSLKQRNFFNG